MKELLELMEVKDWLSYNAKLQMKKNLLRQALKSMGILKKGGYNEFDKYKYFSEAQYKELFTRLLSDNRLELKFDEIEYNTFEGSQKQANGRMALIEFTLIDCETGFYESTKITAEAIDKGDKAGYKAYTGAIKYFLADTFLVATGDDPETESPEQTMNHKEVKKASPKQVELLLKLFSENDIQRMLAANGVEKVEDVPMSKASEYISAKTKGVKNNG